jgi:aspartyl/asparaginyl beta-hydroxylase (cupin superfamily)
MHVEPGTGNEMSAGANRKRRHRPSVAAGLWLIKHIERILARNSLVEDRPILDARDFPWVADLEANWTAVRTELDRILTEPGKIPNFQDISPDQANITRDDRWKTFFLYCYGYRMDGNCDRCPETARLVASIPGMFTALFSVLAPGKHIPLHRGPYKGVLRCHLGLLVPEPREQCWIEVGGERAHWEEGKCVVFDDTYKHRVQNDTAGVRVVLFLDVVRPLRFPGTLLNRMVLRIIRLSPYIRDAVRNQRAWERRLGET